MKQPALYVNGHIVVGKNHGLAFSQLTEDEKQLNFIDGFIDGDIFISAELTVKMGTIICIRHAESEFNAGETLYLDSDLTNRGKEQAEKLALFLSNNIDLKDFVGFTSPFLRCLNTAVNFNIPFSVADNIVESPMIFPENGILIKNHFESFPQFQWNDNKDWYLSKKQISNFDLNLNNFIYNLPEKVILITHDSTIRSIVKKLTHTNYEYEIPNASITIIENCYINMASNNSFLGAV